jgi:hypothetical protein
MLFPWTHHLWHRPLTSLSHAGGVLTERNIAYGLTGTALKLLAQCLSWPDEGVQREWGLRLVWRIALRQPASIAVAMMTSISPVGEADRDVAQRDRVHVVHDGATEICNNANVSRYR